MLGRGRGGRLLDFASVVWYNSGIGNVANARQRALTARLKMKFSEITPHIWGLQIPYHDIFTSVFLVKAEEGLLLFDTASYPSDITDIIIPALGELGIRAKDISKVFISHPHGDHLGGLMTFLGLNPDAEIIVGSRGILERLPDVVPWLKVVGDGDAILGALRAIGIPGHLMDAIGLFDTRTGTLLSGDALQLYGIYGSGKWGSNIRFPAAHLDALERLKTMPITAIYPAHNFHPHGDSYVGKEAVAGAIDACREALLEVRGFILSNPDLDDDGLMEAYKERGLPTVGDHVFAAVRRDLI